MQGAPVRVRTPFAREKRFFLEFVEGDAKSTARHAAMVPGGIRRIDVRVRARVGKRHRGRPVARGAASEPCSPRIVESGKSIRKRSFGRSHWRHKLSRRTGLYGEHQYHIRAVSLGLMTIQQSRRCSFAPSLSNEIAT